MSARLFSHELRQRGLGAAVLGVVLAAFGFLAVVIADSIGGFIDEMTAAMPEAFDTFLGADAPGGYVVGEMFNLIFPIAVVTFAIIMGANILAGEERDGTMAVLAAQPVSRTRLLFAKSAAMLAALFLVVALNCVVMAIFIASGITELTLSGLTGATLHLLLLGLSFGAIAFAVAASTGRPGLGSAFGGSLAVVSYLLANLLPLADLTDWARLSPWHYYLGHSDPLRNGTNPADLGIFGTIVAASLIVAVFSFRNRDLRG